VRVSRSGGRTVRRSVGAHGGAPLTHRDIGSKNPLESQPIEFVGSFPDPKVRVDPALPEIAFIGRSNVGKSSLLNALVGRAELARVSATPGKTTLLNFYRLPGFYLVDLPGYGYARSGKVARGGYRKLVHDYLRGRSTLAGVVWLLDIRRELSVEDREMQDLLVASGRPVLATLTKSDKLTWSQTAPRVKELARSLGIRSDQIQLTSTRSKIGIAELAASIVAAVGRETS
jgi:GTP-binding protein